MENNTTLVEIDGALGEGGGQVLRSCLTLSILTGKPCHILNIRAGRKRPGSRTSLVTPHLLTNIAIIRAFLPVEIAVHGEIGQPGNIQILPVRDLVK